MFVLPAAILGSLVLAFLLLCVILSMARPYTIPALAFSVVASLISSFMQAPPPESVRAFYTLWFFVYFLYWGLLFGVFALTIRMLRENRT